ncbi:MAG: hypothetical protein MMC23_006738 [Stictis urceolatum]|nr:hypothetical protein [Stictis urceolata]
MTSKTCQALVTRADSGKPRLLKESISIPSPGTHQLLVRVSHAAQNPTDVQSFDTNVFGDDAVLGCDFVGTVEQLGDGVTSFERGDVIAGLIWGGEIKGLGAYSEYTIADEHICFKVPKGTSLEEASTIPLASLTSWLALFSKDCLNIDRSRGSDMSLLVWGGSSSVGLYAIQIAAAYGFNIVTTCSEKNFDLVRKYGAHHVFDYKDSGIAHKIFQAMPSIRYVFDTIGNATSSATAADTVGDEGGILCTVRPGQANTENVTARTKVTDVLVWTAFYKDHRYKDFKWPASKEDHDLSRRFCQKLPEMLQSGQIKPSVPKVLGGLDAVLDGFQEHRDGKISAYKLVYAL